VPATRLAAFVRGLPHTDPSSGSLLIDGTNGNDNSTPSLMAKSSISDGGGGAERDVGADASADDAASGVWPIPSIAVGDTVLLRRSDGRWTYARLQKQSADGGMDFQAAADGGTKYVPATRLAAFVRGLPDLPLNGVEKPYPIRPPGVFTYAFGLKPQHEPEVLDDGEEHFNSCLNNVTAGTMSLKDTMLGNEIRASNLSKISACWSMIQWMTNDVWFCSLVFFFSCAFDIYALSRFHITSMRQVFKAQSAGYGIGGAATSLLPPGFCIALTDSFPISGDALNGITLLIAWIILKEALKAAGLWLYHIRADKFDESHLGYFSTSSILWLPPLLPLRRIIATRVQENKEHLDGFGKNNIIIQAADLLSQKVAMALLSLGMSMCVEYATPLYAMSFIVNTASLLQAGKFETVCQLFLINFELIHRNKLVEHEQNKDSPEERACAPQRRARACSRQSSRLGLPVLVA
jgi:hypothetical protein